MARNQISPRTESRDGGDVVVAEVERVQLRQCIKILNDADEVLLQVPVRVQCETMI